MGQRILPERPSRTIAQLKAAKSKADQEKQWAWDHAHEVYRERDLLVGLLTRLFPSHLMEHTQRLRHPKLSICIHCPYPLGQLTWTVTETLRELVGHLELKPNDWDHAKTKRKHERIVNAIQQGIER